MPEDNIDPETSDGTPSPAESGPGRARRRYFTRRNTLAAFVLIAVVGLLITLVSVVSYRYGVFDTYVKEQFVAKMANIGMDFTADVFRVTVNPLELELGNATFTDRTTGERLFFIRNARLRLTVRDLWAWQLTRDISIDRTEIDGAEVWVKFDENGRSNFANLKLIEEEAGTRVNFKYDSVDFVLRDSIVHFGDVSRRLNGNARNVAFSLAPENFDVPDEQKTYRFDLSASDSDFAYEERTVEDIDLRVTGVADRGGARITTFELITPLGDTTMSGTLVDWADPRYDLDIRSSVDLTQASSIFQTETPLVGVGNFTGHLTGHGETYRIEGTADSESIRAGGISVKAVSVTATLTGENSSYEGNGTALARMLTFDDLRIDFLKLAGNVRGTGADFRWWGDLQAAAATAGKTSLGGLFLSDALAEYKDGLVRAEAGSGRAQRFAIGDREFADLQARNLRFAMSGGERNITASSATARSFSTKDFSFSGVSGRAVSIKDTRDRTEVAIDGLRSGTATIKDSRFRGVAADRLRLTDRPGSTSIALSNAKAARMDVGSATIDGLEAPLIRIDDTVGGDTVVYADKTRIARLDTASAVLGSVNVAGVRLTIRQGRVEGRSGDIAAGTITLKRSPDTPDGGTLTDVTIARPVFVLEPSGRYRATADMSIGGGSVGSIALGAAQAKVEVDNNRASLTELNASVLDGRFDGTAVIALNSRSTSTVRGRFNELDLSKLISLQGGRIVPVLQGQASGNIDLTFTGTNFRTASGTLDAQLVASAGAADQGQIPVNGTLRLSGVNGLFNIDVADLRTASSTLTASGRLDLAGNNSELGLALNSSDAGEVARLVKALGLSPTLEEQMDTMRAEFAGALTFNGNVTGNFADPNIDGKAAIEMVSLRGRSLGSLTADLLVSPVATEIRNGKLRDLAGGTIDFAIDAPAGGTNNISVKATLTDVNAGNLLAALPVDLPGRISDFTGRTTGKVDITGLPNNAAGEINLSAANGTVAGQAFDDLNVKAVFTGTRILLERADLRIGEGNFSAKGSYDRGSELFDLDIGGKAVPLPLLLAFLPENAALPTIAGGLDFTAKATGAADRPQTYVVNFSGTAPNVVVNESTLGQVVFSGQTVGQRLTAELTATLDGRPQVVNASLDLSDPDLPFTVATNFDQSPIAPFVAFIPALRGIDITGTGSGRVVFGGELSQVNAAGTRIYSTAGLTGTGEFSQLSLQIEDTPLTAAEPVMIRFNTSEIVFERARFAGGGSNMTVAGVKALTNDGMNNLAIDGRVNLTLLNLATRDTFFSGFADTSVRLTGPNSNPRLSGTADLVNVSVATFLGSDRFSVDRLKARVLFTSNQVQVEDAVGYLGGGRFTGSGGGILNGLAIQAFRFSLDGNNVTVPLPTNFITTGDARLEIAGVRRGEAAPLEMTISGRVFARRSVYSRDIDLANLISGRRDPTLSGGGTASIAPPRFDLVIEGRDALIVRNNIADLTASVSLTLTGDADNPRLAGRITANSGTILFRRDRYVVQRGVLEFPPDTAIDPVINLQAESEIGGYQVFVNLSGPLRDSEMLTATVRSNPALPQADVVSLITTGNLANTTSGIPTLAQSGINTAAEILTDAIINNPARKATDKLFGLNVFEIDPIISGQQLNPSARLTVGRQINNNLRVTYSTNLSQDQNQILAVEYRVSNKLSFIAQYEQRSLSNVTRNRDNFSFEVRFRKRF